MSEQQIALAAQRQPELVNYGLPGFFPAQQNIVLPQQSEAATPVHLAQADKGVGQLIPHSIVSCECSYTMENIKDIDQPALERSGLEEQVTASSGAQGSLKRSRQQTGETDVGNTQRGRPRTTKPESPHSGAKELEDTAAQLSVAEERSRQLEALLQEKDTEILRMRQVIQSKDAAAGQSTSISEQELKQAYCNSVQALKDYINVSNLLTFDITGKNLPEKVTADLKMLIHQISKVCLQAIKPETPYVMDVISKDYNQATTNEWELDKSHWINVIAHLQLTDQQVVTILRARAAHVEKIMALYQERAAFARQAAEIAIVSASSSNGRLGYEDHSMMSVLLRHGYLYCARNMVAVHRLMEHMKESLLREQKTVMELFLKVVYQILSPVQAALFVVESFPYHCDVLALANVLAVVYGKDGPVSHAPAASLLGSAGPGMGVPSQLGGMGGVGNSNMVQAPVNSGGDPDMMASLLQMQMQGPGPLDNLGFGDNALPGASAGMSGNAGGPTSDGLARLRNFLDSAGTAGLGGLGGSSSLQAAGMGGGMASGAAAAGAGGPGGLMGLAGNGGMAGGSSLGNGILPVSSNNKNSSSNNNGANNNNNAARVSGLEGPSASSSGLMRMGHPGTPGIPGGPTMLGGGGDPSASGLVASNILGGGSGGVGQAGPSGSNGMGMQNPWGAAGPRVSGLNMPGGSADLGLGMGLGAGLHMGMGAGSSLLPSLGGSAQGGGAGVGMGAGGASASGLGVGPSGQGQVGMGQMGHLGLGGPSAIGGGLSELGALTNAFTNSGPLGGSANLPLGAMAGMAGGGGMGGGGGMPSGLGMSSLLGGAMGGMGQMAAQMQRMNQGRGGLDLGHANGLLK